MEKIQAVLFDLDGTLVDSVPDLTTGVNALVALWQLPAFSQSQVASYVGKGVRVLLERVLEARALTLSPEQFDLAVQQFAAIMVRNDNREARFYPGALETIEKMRARGIRTALVTNKMRKMTEHFVTQKGLAALFDVIVAGDDVEHPKPAPEMLELACRRLRIAPAQALMIGDSRNDALAARAAKMAVCLVTTGYNEGEPIADWARTNGFAPVFSSVAAIARGLDLCDE